MKRSFDSIARGGVGFPVMAVALASAGLVEDPASAPPAAPPPVDKRSRVMADVRRWLARIVLGERVPVGGLSDALTPGQCSHIGRILRDQGLTTATRGPAPVGGTTATEKLRKMARDNISDDDLAALIWPSTGARSERVEAYRREDAVETAPAGMARKPPTFAPIPRTKAARDAALLAHVRAWLEAVARGERVPASHMTNVVGQPQTAVISKRLEEAGLVSCDRSSPNRSRWRYAPSHPAIDALGVMTDAQLADIVWPWRAGATAAEPSPEEVEAGTAAWAEAANADLAQQAAGTVLIYGPTRRDAGTGCG